MYYFHFLSLPLNPTTIRSWGRSCLCKAPESQTVCKNALLLANESKDSGFQGSVNCSYFSLRQLTKGKKGKARDRNLKDAKDYNIWGIRQGTWVVKVCLEMESHSSPNWSTSGLAIPPMWPNYCAFLLQNVNQWGKGGELSNSDCWSSAMQFLYIPMGGRAKRDIWKPLTDSLHCKAETNTTL